MAKGARGGKNISIVGGGGGVQAPTRDIQIQAEKNIKGVSGYAITGANGDTTEFYFRKSSDGGTLYGNSINHIDTNTPNSWTEKEMIQAVKNNGGTAEKYSKSQLLDTEIKRLEDRAATNEMLNKEYARNRGADTTNKEYRNYKRASRIARRRR